MRAAAAPAFAALAAGLLCAPPPAAADVARVGRHLRESPRLAGDPGGARSRLERLGVSLQLAYNQFVGGKLRGGADRDSTSGHSGSVDFFALVEGEALAGWPGLDLLLHVKGQYDRHVNRDVGALSDPVDDADFDEPVYVDELYLQQSLWDGRVALRLGFQEQQTLYDRNAYANSEDRQFLATFLDNNAVVPLPNGLGAAVLVRPLPWLEAVVGAADADNVPRRSGFDTAFDDLESLTGYLELALRTRLPALAGAPGPLSGTLRVGAFVDGRERAVFGRARRERGHWGAWLSADQLVVREPGPGQQGLGLFARFGYADPDVNAVAWFWSAGLQATGLLPGRDEDVLGVGAYQAIGSSRFRRDVSPGFGRETGVEVYYAFSPLPWLVVTPDFQLVADPGATGAADDAVVVTLRFRVSF